MKFNYNVSSMQIESTKYNCRYQDASYSKSSVRLGLASDGESKEKTGIKL